MRPHLPVYASLPVVLWLAMATVATVPSANADVYVYNYTGTDFAACGPTSSSCPSDYMSDYIIASVSFNGPLADGATVTITDNFSSISAWSISDHLGYLSLSSSDSSAASELEGVQITTNGSGNIVSWYIDAALPGHAAAGFGGFVLQPEIIPHGGGDEMSVPEWSAAAIQNGVWNKSIIVAPEPSYTALTALCGAILLITVRWKHRGRAKRI